MNHFLGVHVDDEEGEHRATGQLWRFLHDARAGARSPASVNLVAHKVIPHAVSPVAIDSSPCYLGDVFVRSSAVLFLVASACGGSAAPDRCVCNANAAGHAKSPGAQQAGEPAREGRSHAEAKLGLEDIQQVIRRSYDRFRLCYEQGLARNPKLKGKIVVQLSIDLDGSVMGAESRDVPHSVEFAGNAQQDEATDLDDRAVVDCVVNECKNLVFPAPETTTLSIIYPVRFDQTPGPSGEIGLCVRPQA